MLKAKEITPLDIVKLLNLEDMYNQQLLNEENNKENNEENNEEK